MSQSGGFSSTALRLSEEKCRDFWQKYELLFPVGTGTVSCVFRTLSVFVWQPRQASKHLEGTYGVVYKARNRDNGRLVAIKQSKKQPGASREEREGISPTTIREIMVFSFTPSKTVRFPCNCCFHDYRRDGFEIISFNVPSY